MYDVRWMDIGDVRVQNRVSHVLLCPPSGSAYMKQPLHLHVHVHVHIMKHLYKALTVYVYTTYE